MDVLTSCAVPRPEWAGGPLTLLSFVHLGIWYSSNPEEEVPSFTLGNQPLRDPDARICTWCCKDRIEVLFVSHPYCCPTMSLTKTEEAVSGRWFLEVVAEPQDIGPGGFHYPCQFHLAWASSGLHRFHCKHGSVSIQLEPNTCCRS